MTTTARLAAHDDHTTVNGVRLHHRLIGPDDGPAAVVLHGIMGHTREWDVVVRDLAADHRIVAVDQRGHGESGWAEEYSPSVMADDLIALVEQLGTGPVRLVGHSMGGMAGLVAAGRRPDLIERLALLDVGPETLLGELAGELRDFLAHLASSSYASVDEAFAVWSENPYARPGLLRHYVEHCLVPGHDGRLIWRFDGRGLDRFFDGASHIELWDAVDRVTCPVLVVRGEHSPALSAAQATEMLARLADGRAVVIPDAAHDLGVEQPEAVAAAVRPFFAGSPTG